MTVRPDDDVVVHGNAQALARLGDLAGDFDVGAAGGGVSARVIVYHPSLHE